MTWYIAGTHMADKVNKVFLDEVEIKDVREAHTGEGWLVRYINRALVRGEHDHPVETLRGKVCVELRTDI